MSEFSGLIDKLDKFIRKYYKNQLLKGLILFVSMFIALLLVISLFEYIAYANSTFRAVLFYSYAIINLVVFVRLIAIPLLKLYKFGKQISYEQASEIIGIHFSEIRDKLLNTLQLQQLYAQQENADSAALLSACIDQKASNLKPYSFSMAIDFKVNRKYLKFLIPVSVVFLFLLIVYPAIITESSNRIIHYNTFFEKPAPFTFSIQNTDLKGLQQQDFLLKVKIDGKHIPDEVFVNTAESEYKLTRESGNVFQYNFRNLQKNIPFFLSAEGFRSKEYEIEAIPVPMIIDFEMQMNYPAYTGRKPEVIKNSGDATVPCGTSVVWRMKTKDAQKVQFKFNSKNLDISQATPEFFTYKQNFYESQSYVVSTQNQYIANNDSLKYVINVIPDAYPSIDIKEYKDSVYLSNLYFRGNINDDYGFSKLIFKYKKSVADDPQSTEISKQIPLTSGLNHQEFYHYFDMSSLNLQPGEMIEYYFEIWDNDGVKGPKMTKSQKYVFKAPTEEEIDKQTEEDHQDFKDKLEQTVKDIKKFQKQVDALDKKLIDKQNLSWQERKQMEDLVKQQKQIQDNLEQLKDQLKENNIKENQFKEADQNILEKQKQLEDLFNKVMTDEMKEMFKQLQEMLDKLDKNKINEALDKMKLTNKEIEKELERNLEIFKKLEIEQKINESIDKLKNLSEEQKKLSEETNKQSEDQQKLIDQQQEINKKFDEISKDLKDAQDKNSKLETPENLLNTEQKESDIKNELNNSSQSLMNKKNSNASKSQKSASQQMEEMADALEKHQKEQEEQDNAEDIQALRMLLENLLKTSFSQEDLMGKVKKVAINDPKFVKIMDSQKELKDDLKSIQDSLYALSKRQPQISAVVNREISLINDNAEKSLKALHDRYTDEATNRQQYVMTSVNNLTLMLAEILQQMQEQQNSSASCKGGKCKKPGNGKPKPGNMAKMQEELNKRLNALKKQLENGQSPGGKNGNSEQFARLAAEQEALRKMMQEYGEELKKEGAGNDGAMSDIMKKMEQTERELVNKVINNETLKRQQDILTRLLESEKADKERELDQERKSQEGKSFENRNPNLFFEYNKIKNKEQELIKTIPMTLNPFYKVKTNEYFTNFEQ